MEFIYVENLVEACMLALKKGKSGEAYHINNGRSYRMQEVIEELLKLKAQMESSSRMLDCSEKIGEIPIIEDIKNRCVIGRYPNGVEVLEFDGVPLIEFHGVEFSTDYDDEHFSMTANLKYKILEGK